MVVICIAALDGCSRLTNRVVSQDVNVIAWEDRAEVVLEHEGDFKRCDMDILLHVNRTFDEESVALELTFITPDSLRYSECVEAPISVDWGTTAKYFSDIAIEYRRDVKLKKDGIYSVSIRPLKPLRGVESAGVNFRMK